MPARAVGFTTGRKGRLSGRGPLGAQTTPIERAAAANVLLAIDSLATRVRPAFGTLTPPRSDLTYVMVTGVALPFGVFRPFGELQSLETFGGNRMLQMAFGASVRTSSAPTTPF